MYKLHLSGTDMMSFIRSLVNYFSASSGTDMMSFIRSLVKYYSNSIYPYSICVSDVLMVIYFFFS